MINVTVTHAQQIAAINETVFRLYPYWNESDARDQITALKPFYPVLNSQGGIEDFLAISGFLTSTDPINAHMRLPSPMPSIYLSTILTVSSGLRRLCGASVDACSSMIAYRGVSLPRTALIAWFEQINSSKDSRLPFAQFLSTSLALSTARTFALLDNSSQWWNGNDERVIFIAKVCSAPFVSFLGYYDFARTQREHLLPPGITFEVLSQNQRFECSSTNASQRQSYYEFFVREITQGTTCEREVGKIVLDELKRDYEQQLASNISDHIMCHSHSRRVIVTRQLIVLLGMIIQFYSKEQTS